MSRGLLADRYLLQVLVLAASYAVAARIAILLAIPPGYATAVWPPAGIAFAALLLGGYRLWPGIFLGSLIKDLLKLLDPSSDMALLESLLLACGISTGATLQALAGAWLAQRFVGYRNLFTQEVDIVRILILGGPVACAINAIIGTTLLWLAGRVPVEDYLYSGWTWWVGDTIGVLIFGPLVLAWALRPISTWLRKQVALTVPITLVFAIVVAIFFNVSANEQLRLRAAFDTHARDFTAELELAINDHQLILDSLKGFYAASVFVDRNEFQLFSSTLLRKHPNVVAIEWLPRVGDAERATFEQRVRAEGDRGFRIFDRDSGGNIIAAPPRAEYFPVLYAEPLAGNEAAIGLDANSLPSRRAAFARAIDTGQSCVTGRIQLIQDTTPRWSVLMANPIYRGAADYPTKEQRRAHLIGIGQVVMRIENIIPSSLTELASKGIGVRILDVSDGTPGVLLHGAASPEPHAAMEKQLTVRVADRTWSLEFALSSQYLFEHRSQEGWAWLAVGLLITALLAILSLVLLGRQAKVEELVATRTAELQAIDADLRRSNTELEQFAYVASHDLSTPLRSMTGFSQMLERDYGSQLDSGGREYIKFIADAARHMEALIAGLLELGRIGSTEPVLQDVDSSATLDTALEDLSAEIAMRGAHISRDPLPVVRAAPADLRRLFCQLLTNAMKFHRPGESPRLHVSATADNDYWRFCFEDNGIGIEPEYRERIFRVFQRLHPTDIYEGTGLGLAICEKILHRHGGRIWVESDVGKGSRFFFTLRRAGN